MLLALNPEILANIGVVFGSVLMVAILMLVPLPGSNITKEILLGLSLLIVMNQVGERLSRNNRAYKSISFVSSLSYYTFLLHHQIIYKVLEGFDSVSTVYSLGVLFVIIFMTILFSYILKLVMKAFLNSRIFLTFEGALLKNFCAN